MNWIQVNIYLYDLLISVFNRSYIAYQLQKQLSPELQSEWISKDVLQWSEKQFEVFMRSSQSTLVSINILVEVSCFKNLCHNKILWSSACLQQYHNVTHFIKEFCNHMLFQNVSHFIKEFCDYMLFQNVTHIMAWIPIEKNSWLRQWMANHWFSLTSPYVKNACSIEPRMAS